MFDTSALAPPEVYMYPKSMVIFIQSYMYEMNFSIGDFQKLHRILSFR